MNVVLVTVWRKGHLGRKRDGGVGGMMQTDFQISSGLGFGRVEGWPAQSKETGESAGEPVGQAGDHSAGSRYWTG